MMRRVRVSNTKGDGESPTPNDDSVGSLAAESATTKPSQLGLGDDDGRGAEHKPAPKRNTAAVVVLWGLFATFLILVAAVRSGHADQALSALGLRRRAERVALLTVATHAARISESADSEAEYGASKTAFSYPFSIDNKARYCQLHQYDLNVDVDTGSSAGSSSEEGTQETEGAVQVAGPRSSRFRKLALIRQLWDSYDWLIWMDIDAIFVDPSSDVLALLDKTADLHFTLEEGIGGAQRVNTGFFVVRTTPFSRDFVERAWAVNDCGRGQSDQRSMNFVLNRVNIDDVECTAAGAAAEWGALAGRHGGLDAAANKVRYYKKSLLNAFPKDVAQFLVPVERYALPAVLGDEQPVSIVVHFAGQYGGARPLDGKMPIGMLAQYLHMLAQYHGRFLDRLSVMEAKAALLRGDSGQFSQYHADGPASDKAGSVRGHGGRHAPGASIGPKTVQDAVFDHSVEWTRPVAEARARLASLEALLQEGCLSRLPNYLDVVDEATGQAYKAPPRMAKPAMHVGAALHARHVDHAGELRVDRGRACDFVGTLSAARRILARVLPEGPRWPSTLLCAAPDDAPELASRLNATRLWLEMRKPSTLAKLQFGAPFFEDDEFALGSVGSEGHLSASQERHKGNGGLPLGPSLYATVDVSPPARSLIAPRAEPEADETEENALGDTLLLAVSECAFLDPAAMVVGEATFAYSASPDEAHRGSSLASQFAFSKEAAARPVHRMPGAVFLPPLAYSAATAVAHVSRGGRLYAEDDETDGGAAAVRLLTLWTYTLPLLVLLLEELPDHVTVVLPLAGDKELRELESALELLQLPPERVRVAGPGPTHSRGGPPSALALGDSGVLYGDLVLSVHATISLATVAANQLFRVKAAAATRNSQYHDPMDDLIICLEEKPLDGAAGGGGTRVADWFTVRAALMEALPSDQVVTYSKNFVPGETAAVELFKRAKLIVVAAGVVPSLLLAIFSSEGIPVIELVGKTQPPHSHGPAESSYDGGWPWTQRVAGGLGLERFSVMASDVDEHGYAVFDPEDIVDAALDAMDVALDDREALDDQAQEAEGEGGGGAEEEAADDFAHRSGRQDESTALSDETADLVRSFGPEVRVEKGLEDRDRLGEFLQRLGNDGGDVGAAFLLGGAGIGVEYGDFSLQVLGRWRRCPVWLVVDEFAPSARVGGFAGEDDAAAVSDKLSSMDERGHSERLGTVTTVLKQYLSNGVAKLKLSSAAAAARTTAASSLSFVYIDGDHSYASVAADLAAFWPNVVAGGMVGGHDFTRAHSGVARAVLEWAAAHNLILFVTRPQLPRDDVLGNPLPPCCPSWYFFKPLDGPGDSEHLIATARRVATEMNEER